MKSLEQLKAFQSLGLSSLNLESCAKEIMENVAALPVGESYSMKGGWYGKPSGHAMIYRFKRTSLNTFDIYIYDAQSNSEKLKGGRLFKGRKQVHPYILLENVHEKDIFFAE